MSLYQNTGFYSPRAVGQLDIQYPFSDIGDVTTILAKQKYYQDAGKYSPPTPNTPFNSGETNCQNYIMPSQITGARLCYDANKTPLDGGLISFERQWLTLPLTHYKFETYAAGYPGYYGVRAPFPQPVQSRLAHDFFLVGSGSAYSTAGDIPLVAESRLTNSNGLNVPLIGGGDDLYLNNGGGTMYISSPTLSGYQALVTSDAATASGYSITIESSIQDHMGNYKVRVTRAVKAK